MELIHQEFEQNILFKDGHYEVGLPWRKPRPILPDNHELSQKRLHSLLRRLRQSPAILQEYDADSQASGAGDSLASTRF